MRYILRDSSVITSNNSLELLYKMEKFPVFIGTTNNPKEEDLFEDMNWYICKESGVIQLNKLLPLEIIYASYHSEAVGGVWKEHHLSFIQYINKYSNKNILEIGGSNGFIAKEFISQNLNKKWTMIEPNPKFLGNKDIKVIKGFFNKNFICNDINTIVHSHVIEHMYNPREFLNDVNNFLQEDQVHIFSVPNLKKYLEQKFTNTINFEHTFFLTEELLDYLLSIYKFEIIEKKYFGDHSIFYATKKNSALQPIKLINHYHEYKNIYISFITFYQNEVKKLNNLIDNFDGKIYLFGAHIFSQFLIYLGLKIEKIEMILDNSEIKTNQRLYGTNIFVNLPKSIEGLKNIAIILKAGQYQEEIKEQLQILNTNCEIWE